MDSWKLLFLKSDWGKKKLKKKKENQENEREGKWWWYIFLFLLCETVDLEIFFWLLKSRSEYVSKMAQKEIVAKKIITINSSKIHCKNLRYIILRNPQQQVYSCTCFYIVAGFVVNVGYIKYFAAWPKLETKKKKKKKNQRYRKQILFFKRQNWQLLGIFSICFYRTTMHNQW